MMIPMTLVAALTVIGLALVYVLASARRGTLLARARQKLEEEEAKLQASDDAATAELLQALEGGKTVEQALPDYLQQRGGLLPAQNRSGRRWDWTQEDVERWAETEWARRSAEISRRVLVPALLWGLLLLLAAFVTLGILWQQEGPRKVEDGPGVSVPAESTRSDEDGEPAAPASTPPTPPPGRPAPPAAGTPPQAPGTNPGPHGPDEPEA
jgi:hypothetical protein